MRSCIILKKILKTLRMLARGINQACVQNLFLSNKKLYVSLSLQSNQQQQSTRAGTTGIEFRKLRPADLKGGTGRT